MKTGVVRYGTEMNREVIRAQNEFGGKTIMVSYVPDDVEYVNGIANAIIYYDGNEKVIKVETFNTEESARHHGIVKTITVLHKNEMILEFYDQQGRLVRTLP